MKEKEFNLSECIEDVICQCGKSYICNRIHMQDVKEFIKLQIDKPINPDCQCCVSNRHSLIEDAGDKLK